METKDFGLSVKDVSDEGTFEGYGSTFGGAPDSYGDIVMPGAFAESLVRHKREGTMPLLLWGHQSNELPIGRWVDMAEDGKGLWGKAEIDLDDPVGNRVHKALKRKSVRGLSIGFETITRRADPKRQGVSLLEKLELWEVSVVNFPANRRSLVDAVKSGARDVIAKLAAGERLTEREWERLFKESPFDLSNSQAERAVRINLKNGQGDPDETATDPLAAFIAAMRDAPVIDLTEEE